MIPDPKKKENKMKKMKFRAEQIGTNKIYNFTALNYSDARHWVINHLDLSYEYCIVHGWKTETGNTK